MKDRYLFYCPSCKKEEYSMELTNREFNDISTTCYIGDCIIDYIICPNCGYVLAGARRNGFRCEKKEDNMVVMKMYVDRENTYISELYDEMLGKAKLKVNDNINKHLQAIEKLKKAKYKL